MSSKIRKGKKSSCWHFYSKTEKGGICRLCDRDVKTSGNTTNLINHLKRKHSPQWRATLGGREEEFALSFLEKDEHEPAPVAEEQQQPAVDETQTLQAYQSEDGNTIIWLQHPPVEEQNAEYHPHVNIADQQSEREVGESATILSNGEVHHPTSTTENTEKATEEETATSASRADEPPKKVPSATGSVQAIRKFLQNPKAAKKPTDTPAFQNVQSRAEDSFDFFGKYIASLLRSLPSRRAACKLQKEMVCWALQEHIDWKIAAAEE